tara:strand:- start:5948 stop:6763 length:816 start_codon:yes stop_codon:yes gene_type:complete
MFRKPLRVLKKLYQETRELLSPHPLFRTIDKIKLSKIKRDKDKKGFVFIKPKGFSHNIKIRRNYIDKEVIHYVLQDQYHLPPKISKITNSPIILDLGSNIGLTIAHMKHIYPNAQIIGYEMNRENFLLAKRNTKFYDKVIIYNKAVWTEDTTVIYKNSLGYDAYAIINNEDTQDIKQEIERVQSISIASIIKNHKLEIIDYLKMDIEGAEEAILLAEDLSWMNKVRAMNIEMHLDDIKEIDRYINIIKNKGFNAWKDDKHWSSIFAVRKDI